MRYGQAVGSKTMPNCWEPTLALREQSIERLGVELNRYMVASERNVEADWRDVLVGLAPYYDCAMRLGIDPVELLERASKDLNEQTRELARTFAGRSDITLHAFGWMLASTSEGPCYQPMKAL
jgi:hypothetical protein